jgi:hypothetical protein
MRSLALLVLTHLIFLAVAAEAKGDGAELDDDVLGLIVFNSNVADLDGHLATWTEDDTRHAPGPASPATRAPALPRRV